MHTFPISRKQTAKFVGLDFTAVGLLHYLSVCPATDLNITGWSKWSTGSHWLSLIGRAMLILIHGHSKETHRATFIQYQTLPTVGVSTVYPACEGYSRLYNKTTLAWSIYLSLLLRKMWQTMLCRLQALSIEEITGCGKKQEYISTWWRISGLHG